MFSKRTKRSKCVLPQYATTHKQLARCTTYVVCFHFQISKGSNHYSFSPSFCSVQHVVFRVVFLEHGALGICQSPVGIKTHGPLNMNLSDRFIQISFYSFWASVACIRSRPASEAPCITRFVSIFNTILHTRVFRRGEMTPA